VSKNLQASYWKAENALLKSLETVCSNLRPLNTMEKVIPLTDISESIKPNL